ncbi:MAG: polyphenol oxidase family protein [Thermoanaerobaculia bacterium]|nr:polyphenol oxidase family protein [Thermoanaerobaculia bacterium]
MQFLHRDSLLFESGSAGEPSRRLVQIAFTGKGLPATKPEDFGRAVGDLLPVDVEPAWVRQIHSADVLEARSSGPCGPADALTTRGAGLGLSVVTADCVPVLLAGWGTETADGLREPQIAAVHAGWRGIAAGIVGEATSRFVEPPRAAWIGPAIGGTVYEVGPEVAGQIAAAADESVVSMGPNGREHVDLRRAVESQLRSLGVGDVRQVDRCTYSDESLWSYRRDGERAGRNLSVIWIEP